MRRRGRRENAVSLFAFQDVMASVIGILFFVVLLMALDMVDAKAASFAEDPNEPLTVKLRRLIQDRETELNELKEDVTRAAMKVDLAVKDDKDILAAIQELDRRLLALHRTVGECEGSLGELDAKIADQENATKRASQQEVLLKKEIEEAKADLDEAGRTPRLSYIISTGTNQLEPWLVVLSSKSIRVGSKDGKSAVTSFRAETTGTREQQFLAWAKTQDRRTHYFVLLIRPSACELAEEMAAALKKSGYHIGTDLVPEDWQVLE